MSALQADLSDLPVFNLRRTRAASGSVGIPAFDPEGGIDYVGKPAGWGMKMRAQYTANDYHKPSDTVKPYWDLSGAVQDAQLYLLVGDRVVEGEFTPQWSAKSEFWAARMKSQG